MSRPNGHRGAPARRLVRTADGTLVDERSGEAVTVVELGRDIAAGQRFSVTDDTTEARCTYAVLAEILGGHQMAAPNLFSLMASQLRRVGTERTFEKGDDQGGR